MHIIISVLIGIATLVFWLGRAAQGAREIADTAQEISNLPRKLRYRKKAGRKGLDLIEEPVEAATILMISIARMDDLGRVSDNQATAIADQLVDNMQLSRDDATDMVLQLRSLSQHLKQPDSALYPMLEILRGKVDKADAFSLSAMMLEVAETNTPARPDQENFIHRFEERMGIGS